MSEVKLNARTCLLDSTSMRATARSRQCIALVVDGVEAKCIGRRCHNDATAGLEFCSVHLKRINAGLLVSRWNPPEYKGSLEKWKERNYPLDKRLEYFLQVRDAREQKAIARIRQLLSEVARQGEDPDRLRRALAEAEAARNEALAQVTLLDARIRALNGQQERSAEQIRDYATRLRACEDRVRDNDRIRALELERLEALERSRASDEKTRLALADCQEKFRASETKRAQDMREILEQIAGVRQAFRAREPLPPGTTDELKALYGDLVEQREGAARRLAEVDQLRARLRDERARAVNRDAALASAQAQLEELGRFGEVANAFALTDANALAPPLPSRPPPPLPRPPLVPLPPVVPLP